MEEIRQVRAAAGDNYPLIALDKIMVRIDR